MPEAVSNELRRISSYVIYFRDGGRTKEDFEATLRQVDLNGLEEMLRGLHWRYEMVEEELCLVKQRCAVCFAPGFLKCQECQARRYCGQACQERDLQEGHLDSCQETARVRRVRAAVMDRVVEAMFEVGEGITFSYFYDRIVKLANSLVRKVMKRHMEEEDSYDGIMRKYRQSRQGSSS